MNICIVGGGELGSLIAEQLINENHDLTIIEISDKQSKKLSDQLDAYVITGSGTNISDLEKANIQKADLFLALSNDDNVNIVSCGLVKKISNATTISKVENYNHYFKKPQNDPSDFGIEKVIATKKLSIDKIMELLSEPDAIEHIHFMREKVKIIGVQISEEFSGNGKLLKEFTVEHDIWKKVRIVAVKDNNQVYIPDGNHKLKAGNILYIIGKSKVLRETINLYFASKIKIRNVIIIGGNRIGREFARIESGNSRKVTIIEEDEELCAKLSEELENVLIVNGSGTNKNVLSELDMEKSFVACVTDSDEYNIFSAVLAKKNNAYKAVCNISNVAISSIINQVKEIDSVFSTETLALAEIIKYCRKGNILSITPIPYLDAETIKIKISKKLPILGKPINEIKFPPGMIIGVIVRGDEVIIPHGDDKIIFNDIVIIFVLPESKKRVEKLFS